MNIKSYFLFVIIVLSVGCSKIQPGSVHNEGDEEYEYEYSTLKHLKMNWGWDGVNDDVYVSLMSSGLWSVDGHHSRFATIVYSITNQ